MHVDGDIVGRDKNVYEAPATSVPAIHQLRPPPRDFTGRKEELDELRAAIEKGGVTISGLQGLGGVGKTALALKLADELKPRYPDAQFYLDLKGVSKEPVHPKDAMGYVIRSCHPDINLPENEAELAGLYQSVLHDKRAILLLDNARDAEQVRPLIPPLNCILLVTSRQHFTLPGLFVNRLDTLLPVDSEALLITIAPRIDGLAKEISLLCGFLPQALRLAASALANRNDLSLTDYVRQLGEQKNRLQLLRDGDQSVEASIRMSYGLLDQQIQRYWRILGVFPDKFDGAAAASVWEIETGAAQNILGVLLQCSMLEWDEASARYRLHDLMRDFARAACTHRNSMRPPGITRRTTRKFWEALMFSTSKEVTPSSVLSPCLIRNGSI
ncbi:MAG TPA: hypothetical protein VJO16_06950 [Candidatus Acidoferrum sp.]|nr:hypothetical protein [Candidatus Acidoferrum sp.]